MNSQQRPIKLRFRNVHAPEPTSQPLENPLSRRRSSSGFRPIPFTPPPQNTVQDTPFTVQQPDITHAEEALRPTTVTPTSSTSAPPTLGLGPTHLRGNVAPGSCACTCHATSGERTKQKSQRRSPRTDDEKLDEVLKYIQDNLNWSLGQFLYFLFRVEDDDGEEVHRRHRHAAAVSKFLRGQSTYTAAKILNAWLRTPDGIPKTSEEHAQMYQVGIPYLNIRLVRPAITSFAAQAVLSRLVKEQNTVVKPENGLHAARPKRLQVDGRKYNAISPRMFEEVMVALQSHQPLAWSLLGRLSEPKAHNGVISTRTFRPPEQVSATYLCILTLTRHWHTLIQDYDAYRDYLHSRLSRVH